MTSLPRMHPIPFGHLAAWLLAGGTLLGCLDQLLPHPGRAYLLDSTTVALNLAAAWILIRRWRAGESARLFFLLVASALAIQAARTTAGLLGIQGLPGLLQAFYVSFFFSLTEAVLQGIAVLCWPTPQSGWVLRWREFLDALLFTTSLFLVIWLTGLGDLVSQTALPFRQKAAQLAFSLDYTLLMGLALYRGLNAPKRFASSLGWILVTFFVISAGNLVWIGLFLRNHYYAGHPLDLLGLLISVLYLLTALAPTSLDRRIAPRRVAWGSLVLPYIPFLLALPLLVQQLPRQVKAQDSVALWLGLGMVGLLLLRQLVALWDSHNFSRSLEAQVQRRTLALEESQSMLLRTQRMNILATLGAGIAHDLKNLLSVVVMTTDLMEEETEAGQPLARRDLETLRKASAQAGDLVQKLLAFGRRGESQPRVFDLRESIQGMTILLEKLATPSVKPRWELGSEPLFLEMDPIQIEQILVNLVANARDAMPEGGILRIRTERQNGPEGAQAALIITDSGTGIPEENLGRLFDAFFTTKEPGKGTGLGLASVKAIADECGANISVESQLGVGTTFTLRFPLAT